MANLVLYTGIDRPRATADSGIMSKRGVRLKAAQGPVFPQGTKASLTVGTSNAALKVTAVQGGVWANTKVKFAIVVSGVSTAQSVVTAFDAAGVLTITLNSATNGSSVATTTATAGAAAINADPTANQFVTASTPGTGATVVVAGAATVLASGANGTGSSESLWVRVANGSFAVVDVTDGTSAKIIRRQHDRLVSLGAAGNAE